MYMYLGGHLASQLEAPHHKEHPLGVLAHLGEGEGEGERVRGEGEGEGEGVGVGEGEDLRTVGLGFGG